MSWTGFATTHVGSLPRPEYLLDLVFAREGGEAVSAAAFDDAVEQATAEIVRRQKQAGVTIVNDGEMSKPSYATYIKHRLSGFGGEAGQYEFQDLEEFPGAKAQVFGNKGRAKRSAPACTAPITVIDMDAPRIDAERLKRLADGHATFMSAASPGVGRSTRRLRQSSRSRSQATRYQRRPQATRWIGSMRRRVAAR